MRTAAQAATWGKSPCEHISPRARFIADARQHCRPLDRNQRARILFEAKALDRRTKPTGGRNGLADLLISQVRGAFIVAQYIQGARVANDILGLLAEIIRSLDAIEQTITPRKP